MSETRDMKNLWSRCVDWLYDHYLCIVTVGVLLVYGMTYSANPFGDPIRSDGAGYYAYLPSFILYGDPSYQRDAEVRYDGEFPRWTYVRIYPPTGRYLNALNIGVSLMTLPFFLMAHVLTIWFGFPWEGGHEFLRMRFAPDGYSFFYQHGAGLAGVFYFLFGLLLLKRELERYFSRGVVAATLTAVLLGTNLLYYGVVFTVNAHSFTFFLSVSLIVLTRRWYENPAQRGVAIGLGVVAALLFLVRPLNVLMWCWFPLYGITSWSALRERVSIIWTHRMSILWMALAAFVVVVPQLLIWKYSSGHFIVKAYQHMGSSDFGMPDMVELLFGINRGMLTWFPIFLFCYAGLLRFASGSRPYVIPVVLLMLIYPVIIGSYQGWLTAGGFGNRYVVDMVVFAAFPLAALYDGLRSTTWRAAAVLCTWAFVLWAVFLFTLLFRREIGFYGLDADALFDVFWWRKESLINWWRL